MQKKDLCKFTYYHSIYELVLPVNTACSTWTEAVTHRCFVKSLHWKLCKIYWKTPVTERLHSITQYKDVKELSWMSHRVIRFWFLLNFLFISAFFDILASLSISRGFFQNNYQIWLYKLNLMCEELSYQIINISAVNQAVFCYY